MDIVTTSLDALLHKATNSSNQNVDGAAVEAFCALINKERDGPQFGAKLLAVGIHSKNEFEALNTLFVLDTAMKRCNNSFHSEIGKFRFLNEMIKLVSPKYLGSQTPLSVKQKVLQLLYIWTLDYPKETKIKEAYEMLKKQGVIREVPLSVCADNITVQDRQINNSIFQDEEKNKLLQKLLQSKNPEDLQAANRLIKNMVKEDDKRAELKSRKIIELESVNNNVRLLNEMLDSYKPQVSSADELELIKELHQSCERLRSNVFKLISETPQNEEILNQVLQASEELNQVFDKYTEIIVKGNMVKVKITSPKNDSLLDLESCSLQTGTEKTNSSLLDGVVANKESPLDMDLLCDVFTTAVVTDSILTPISSKNEEIIVLKENDDSVSKLNKLKALNDLDALGEHMMNENLSSKRIGGQFNKAVEKIPLNVLAKQSLKDNNLIKQPDANILTESVIGNVLNLDLNYLADKDNRNDSSSAKNGNSSGDDVLVDITEEKSDMTEIKVENGNNVESKVAEENRKENSLTSPTNKRNLKLSDMIVKLEDVKPGSTSPLVVLNEKNGITVTFHFGRNKPREDVNVIVVTTISKNELPISNFLFQAVVPKTCKLKLQPASCTELPAYNPFLPPSAITQIMLIANPEKTDISLKFIISYIMDDETYTEMGDVDSFPIIC